MSRYNNWYPPYVSAAEKKYRNEKMATSLAKGGKQLSPVRIIGNKIAKSTETVFFIDGFLIISSSAVA